jgi:hypothetical protein
VIEPKLTSAQFDTEGKSKVSTVFAGNTLEVLFENSEHLEYGDYSIGEVKINGKKFPLDSGARRVKIPRATLASAGEQISIMVKFLGNHQN